MEIQPDNFDLILLGTGLQESLIAAAASLCGLSVLHLDPQADYGSHWADLTLGQLLDWAQSQRKPCLPRTPDIGGHHLEERADREDSEVHVERRLQERAAGVYSNVEVELQADFKPASERDYSFTLAPKLLYTVGPLAESLLRCKAEDYLTFRLVHSFLWKNGEAVRVPASRADIFQDRNLSPGDKRVLMRFLKNAVDALNGHGILKDAFDNMPSQQLLSQEGLTDKLQEIVLYSLAMLNTPQDQASQQHGAAAESRRDEDEVPAIDASTQARSESVGQGLEAGSSTSSREVLEEMGRYVASVQRHGGAFMTPDYGCGELPQAFCRVAAVHGSIYVLRCGIESLLLDRDGQRCQAVKLANGQILKCTALAANVDLLPPEFVAGSKGPGISRAIALVEQSLGEAEEKTSKGNARQMLLVVPPNSVSPGVPRNPVRVLQLGSQSMVAPQGRFVLHLSTLSSYSSASADLKPVLLNLLGNQEPPHLAVFYNQKSAFEACKLPQNVALCQPPDETIGFATAIKGAKAAFESLFPTHEFLPAQENPEPDSDSDY